MTDRNKAQSLTRNQLDKILESKDPDKIRKDLSEFGLEIKNGKIFPKDEYKSLYVDARDYYDKQQLVKKINF